MSGTKRRAHVASAKPSVYVRCTSARGSVLSAQLSEDDDEEGSADFYLRFIDDVGSLGCLSLHHECVCGGE